MKITGIYKIQSTIKPDRFYEGTKGLQSCPNKGKTGIYSEKTLVKMRVSNKKAWEKRKRKII